MFTLFKKELRQHGILAVAAVVICLLCQAWYCWLTWYGGFPYYDFGTFLFTASAVTVVYAGVAAAIAYSTEHANKTFIFLRKLPISHTMLAGGKIGWVLCGTGLVLIANLLLCAFWWFFLKDAGLHMPYTDNSNEVLNTCTWFALIIAKAFFWGLLWTTLCRSQMNAIAATAASIMGVAGGFVYICWLLETKCSIIIPLDEDSAKIYNLVEIVCVASLALWRVFHWFDFEAKESRAARLLSYKIVLFRYPQRVQSQFAALVHHHFRHASASYHLGILSCLVFSLGFLFMMCYLTDDQARSEYTEKWWWTCGSIASIFGVFVLWGTIFGHDLKNNSYLFLSRMGVHEGKFWWSRIVPAMLIYTSVFISIAVSYYVDVVVRQDSLAAKQRFWTEFVPATLAVWLSLPALGTFMSLSFRSQVVAFVLTGCAMYALVLWMVFFNVVFDCSPLWTALPICVAFFVASRLRARYWFKETFTWRSRLIPLAPVFAMMLAVLMALPFVRIYSVPYVSWEQIDAYFDQAEFDKDIIRAPEKRKALLQHIARYGTVPPEYENWLELMKGSATGWELNAFSGCAAEEFLLLGYMQRRIQMNDMYSGKYWRELRAEDPNMRINSSMWLFSSLFWEPAREERISRLQIVTALVESGGILEKRALANQQFYEKHKNNSLINKFTGMMYARSSDGQRLTIMEVQERIQCYQQMRLVFQAIGKWYAEHEQTLPESLDELVEAGYLSAFPEHPFTRERMGYFRDSPVPDDVDSGNISFGNILGTSKESWNMTPEQQVYFDAARKAVIESLGACTYLRLGKYVYVIIEDREPPTVSAEEEEEE